MSDDRDLARERRARGSVAAVPAPLAQVLELLAGESAASRTFIGGLVLGALVGAAFAGGASLRRGIGRRTPRGGLKPGR